MRSDSIASARSSSLDGNVSKYAGQSVLHLQRYTVRLLGRNRLLLEATARHDHQLAAARVHLRRLNASTSTGQALPERGRAQEIIADLQRVLVKRRIAKSADAVAI